MGSKPLLLALASAALGACAPTGPVRGPGTLAPAQIQSVVRQRFGIFRRCYEAGLEKNPHLDGRVNVYFVIEDDGHVTREESRASDLPDSDVVACIVNGFGALQFPPPKGGFVTVVYPLIFHPGD